MRPWFTLAAALVAAGGGYWAWQARQAAPEQAQLPPPPAIDAAGTEAADAQLDRLPPLRYPDLSGEPRDLADWQDKVLVVNFWATWCPPCREETPLFVALQDEYRDRGVQFIGIAIDEPEAVQNFADTYGVEYPILIGDMQAVAVSKRLGNRFSGLPYTVIAKPGGEIVVRHAGGLKREQIAPLLERLAKPAKGG